MRSLAALAITGLVLATLGGCRSDEQMRTALRESGINACVQGYQRTQTGGGDLVRQLDPRAICTCTIDRMMAGRTTDDLQTIVAQPPTPEQRQMARICLMAAVEAQSPSPPPPLPPPPAPTANEADAAR